MKGRLVLMISVGIKLLTDTAIIPRKAHPSDAAFDLYANAAAVVNPQTTVVVGTGVALDLPNDLCAFVMSRSGMAAKSGLFVLNSPGLIDSGYRGEIKAILHNCGNNPILLKSNDRIAQLFFNKVAPITLAEIVILSSTDRKDNGLGSTGVEYLMDEEGYPSAPI
jgi:dUTP pyrophosphatase